MWLNLGKGLFKQSSVQLISHMKTLVALKRAGWIFVYRLKYVCVSLRSLTADAACQLDVLGHDGHPLGVDGTDVGVLEQSHKICFTGLLESHDSRALEAEPPGDRS